MDLAQEIIEKLHQGENPEYIRSQYAWDMLSTQEREILMEEAEAQLTNPEGEKLILALLYLTFKVDDWNFLRALAYYLLRKDIKTEMKRKALKQMGEVLEKISKTIGEDCIQDIERYKQYRADYRILFAKVQEEDRNLEQALQNYQVAKGLYQDCGSVDKVEETERQIVKINGWITKKASLIPLEALKDEYLQLEEEINVLGLRQQEMDQEYESARRDHRILSDDIQQLELVTLELTKENQYKNDSSKKLNSEIEQKENRLGELDAGFEFLMALPCLATAPLWVEVVSLALKQGEIDELTILAMKRLTANGSLEAFPLLAEIVARMPETLKIDPITFEKEGKHWLTGIAKARSLQESDRFLAAQIMTDAWETFFNLREKVNSDE